MRRNVWIRIVLAGLIVAAVAPQMAIAQAHEHEGAGSCPVCDFKRQSNEAAPWLKWGGDFRARAIWDKNMRDMDAVAPADDTLRDATPGGERFWQRYRTRLWATVTPIEDVDLNVGLTWEWYNWCRPTGSDTGTNLRDTDLDEVIIDKLNVEWRNAFGLPMTVKVGRQHPGKLNDWWFYEGTPLDGSRTAFFDMARVTYELEDWQTTVDGFFIWQCSDQDRWLRPVNDRDRALIENDEVAAVLYVRNKSLERTQIDGYYVWRKTNMETAGGFDSDISTVGTRLEHDIDDNWKLYAELAGQFGQKAGVEVAAMGFNSKLRYYFKDEWNNNLRIGYEYRSGSDEPNGSFDILWGRCFQCLNIYQGGVDRMEGPAAMFTNLHRLQAGWSCNPMEKLGLHFDYHVLWADNNQQDRYATPAQFSSNGNFRGHLLTAMATYEFNEHVSTHLIGEYFCPGNFYSDRNDDPAFFARWQVMVKF